MKAIIHGFALSEDADVTQHLEDVFLDMKLPFIPSPGTSINVSTEGGCFTVDLVQWDFAQPDRIYVFMREPVPDEYETLRPLGKMLAQGWRKELELR